MGLLFSNSCSLDQFICHLKLLNLHSYKLVLVIVVNFVGSVVVYSEAESELCNQSHVSCFP